MTAAAVLIGVILLLHAYMVVDITSFTMWINTGASIHSAMSLKIVYS